MSKAVLVLDEMPGVCADCPFDNDGKCYITGEDLYWNDGDNDDNSNIGNDCPLKPMPEPRVMTPADVNNIGPEDVCAFVEIREETHMYACYMRQYDETHTEIMCDVPDLPTKLNNGCVRLWTSRPTDEQREAEPWKS